MLAGSVTSILALAVSGAAGCVSGFSAALATPPGQSILINFVFFRLEVESLYRLNLHQCDAISFCHFYPISIFMLEIVPHAISDRIISQMGNKLRSHHVDDNQRLSLA